MLGLVGRKRHEAELLAAHKEAERLDVASRERTGKLESALARNEALLYAEAQGWRETQAKAEAALATAKETEQELQKQNNELARALFAKTETFDTQAHALLEAHAASEAAQEDARRAEELRLEAESKSRVAEADKAAADLRCKAAEAETARVCACHAGRVRVFVMPIDPLEMTARARAVEGSIRVQWSADERAVVCDSGRPLTEAEYNAVVAAVVPQLNKT